MRTPKTMREALVNALTDARIEVSDQQLVVILKHIRDFDAQGVLSASEAVTEVLYAKFQMRYPDWKR